MSSLNRLRKRFLVTLDTEGGVGVNLFWRGFRAKEYWLTRGHVRYGLWDKLVFDGARATLGLDRLRLVVTGGAPVAPHTLNFARIVFACPVAVVYGQTETGGCGTMSRLAVPVDTEGDVGAPSACAEVRLVSAPDLDHLVTDTKDRAGSAGEGACRGRGEVCVRGPSVPVTTPADPATAGDAADGRLGGDGDGDIDGGARATAVAALPPGWVRTGDIGMWSEYGNLVVFGKRDNVLVTRGGGRVFVERVESVYAQSLLVRALFVHGSWRHDALVAVVLPDLDFAELWKRRHAGLRDATAAEVCASDAYRAAVLADLKQLARAAKLAAHEVVVAVHVEVGEWRGSGALVAPSGAVRRHAAAEAYRHELDALQPAA